MKVSFDGMRKNATNSMNSLHSIIEDIIFKSDLDENYKEDLILRFNTAAMLIDSFNCLFDPQIENDFNDLTDILNIKRLEEL
jgi:hypothetical protein